MTTTTATPAASALATAADELAAAVTASLAIAAAASALAERATTAYRGTLIAYEAAREAEHRESGKLTG